jgi:DNA-binding TFAR19-related protein (PDSD5 family)
MYPTCMVDSLVNQGEVIISMNKSDNFKKILTDNEINRILKKINESKRRYEPRWDLERYFYY